MLANITEIENQIQELIEIYREKKEAIYKQEYQKSAILRDSEKRILESLYMMIYPGELDFGIGFPKKTSPTDHENAINEYMKEVYGVEGYKEFNSLRQIRRIITLRKLGI